MSFIRRHQLMLVFALVSLAVLGPLLKPGYILTLDSPIAFNQEPIAYLVGLTSIPTSVFGATDNSAPYSLVMAFFDSLVPGWFVQKVLLFLIFFLAGFGVTRLPLLQGVGRYYAGVFYAINPFIYIRFLAGQWGLLLGYALTPFALKAFIDFLDTPTHRNAIRVALLSTLIALAQLHALALLLLLFLLIGIVKLARERLNISYRRLLRGLAVAFGLFIVINLFWIVPFVADMMGDQTVPGQLGDSDKELYQPVAVSPFGVVFDVASLHGFWRVNYQYAGDFFSLWWLPFIATIFLTILGTVTWLSRGKGHWVPLGLAVLGAISFILALGVATAPTKFIFDGLWAVVPGFSVFRDSQKFAAILALAYAYLGALGVQEMWRLYVEPRLQMRWHWGRPLVGAMVFLPLLFAFPLVGAAGQMGTTDFPREWHEVREVFEGDQDDYQILFLPWHMYIGFGWLPNDDKTLASQGLSFFGTKVITADNIEYGPFSQSVNPVSHYIEFLLSRSQELDNLGELLAPLNVRYVILVHEADFPSYDYLKEQKDLRIVMERPGITLLQNTYPHGPVYAVDGVKVLASLDELVELSRTEDILGKVYVLESDVNSMESTLLDEGTPEFPTVKRAHLARFKIGETNKDYTVFVTKYGATSRHWRLDGRGPELMNLGMMPTYSSAGSEAVVSFSRSVWLVALDSLGLFIALVSVGYLLWPRVRLLIAKGEARHVEKSE